MSIDAATGVVSGIPDASGAVTYVIQVTDSLGNVADTSPGCALTVSEVTLACPVGGGTSQIGVFYDQFLVAAGGTPPYTFEIIP
jgi:hypothetical protein